MSKLPFRVASRSCATSVAIAVLLAASSVVSQDNPKISAPTLKAGSAPPLPLPAAVTPAPVAQTNAHSPIAASGGTNAASASSTPAPRAAEEKATLTFKFEPPATAVDLLRMYGDLTGRNVIQSPTMPATPVSIDVRTPLTKPEAILALETVLYAYGVSVTPVGDKFVKAVANANIAREGVALSGTNAVMPEGDRVTAQVISLRYLDVSDSSLVQSLQLFIHQPGGTLLPLARSNSILIIDTALSIKRLEGVIERLDQPVENRVLTRFFTLKYAEAAKVATTLQALITGVQPAPGTTRPVMVPPRGAPGGAMGPSEESIVVGKVTIQADERTNTLIIMSRPANFEFLEQIIDVLDAKMEPEIRFRSFKLQHAKAEDVSDQILALTGSGAQPTIQRSTPTRTTTRMGGTSIGGTSSFGGSSYNRNQPNTQQPQAQLPPIATRPTMGGTTTPGQPNTAALATPEYVLSSRARVIPDPRQGSILVLGTAQDLELVERIIKETDFSGPQVIIEMVIVEVKLDNSTQFGVSLLQKQFEKGGVKGAGASLPSGSFSNVFVNPSTLTSPTSLADLGLGPGLTYFAQMNGLNLGMAVQALATSDNFKVLQTPIIQSSQNEPAHFFVGETRPIVTGTESGLTVANSSVGIISQIQQVSIGVWLDITPNITPAGLVQLDVSQSVEDISGSVTIDGNPQPIVSQRELSSLVSVQNNAVVVLGGLIRKDKTKNESKVPILGDIPLFGHLFKQTKWENTRTELIVLIHPTVLPTVEIAQREAQKMRDFFKGLDNIPQDILPPLPKEPEPGQKKPWYAPFQPPKDQSQN